MQKKLFRKPRQAAEPPPPVGTWTAPKNHSTCGKQWHLAGTRFAVLHCGHPTALFPYYGTHPNRRAILLSPSGRAWSHVVDARAAVEIAAAISGELPLPPECETAARSVPFGKVRLAIMRVVRFADYYDRELDRRGFFPERHILTDGKGYFVVAIRRRADGIYRADDTPETAAALRWWNG